MLACNLLYVRYYGEQIGGEFTNDFLLNIRSDKENISDVSI